MLETTIGAGLYIIYDISRDKAWLPSFFASRLQKAKRKQVQVG